MVPSLDHLSSNPGSHGRRELSPESQSSDLHTRVQCTCISVSLSIIYYISTIYLSIHLYIIYLYLSTYLPSLASYLSILHIGILINTFLLLNMQRLIFSHWSPKLFMVHTEALSPRYPSFLTLQIFQWQSMIHTNNSPSHSFECSSQCSHVNDTFYIIASFRL